MSERVDQRLNAATGLVFVGLLLAAAAVGFWFPGWSAEFDSSAQEWAAFYINHRTSILLSVLLVSLALIFLLWFFGAVHALLRRAEGGSERLSTIGFGAAIFGVGAIHVAMLCFTAAAFRADHMRPELIMMMNDMAFICGVPAAAAGVTLFAAVGLATLRTRALPRWLGWFAMLTAVLQLGPLGGLFTKTGPFNLKDGLFGIMLVFITLAAWVTLASVVMIYRAANGEISLGRDAR